MIYKTLQNRTEFSLKKFLFFLISFLFCFSVFAESGISKPELTENKNLFNFTIEPIFGARIGHFGEQVFSKNTQTGETYKLSELIYEFDPALYTGFNTDFKVSNFHLLLGTKIFFPMRSGKMSDSDWCQDAGYQTGNTSLKTNYSEHENYLKSSFNFDAAIKYDFHPTSWLTLSPAISLLYEQITFSTRNGTCWYGNKLTSSSSYSYYSYDDVPNRTVSKGYGEIVQLRRKDIYTWIGLDALFTTSDLRWNFFCGIYIAPYIYTHGEDDHYMRDLYYIDTTASLFYAGKTEIFVKYNFSNTKSIKLSSSFLFTGSMKGTEIYKNSRNAPYQKGSGTIGATSMYVDIQLSGLFIF